MTYDMIFSLLTDGCFAAVAAVGFSTISKTPSRAWLWCGLTAAAGHALRFALLSGTGLHIVAASTVAAMAVGLLAVLFAPRIKCPAEVCLFPALLPMIPGMYAYRTVQALMACIASQDESQFIHCFYLLAYNGFTCSFIILGMVIGANIPIFIFKTISFRATR